MPKIKIENEEEKEVENMKMPDCCGQRMHIESGVGRFVMVSCQKCGDVVYLKKHSGKPELIEFMG